MSGIVLRTFSGTLVGVELGKRFAAPTGHQATTIVGSDSFICGDDSSNIISFS
jgi:hypothetical protein